MSTLLARTRNRTAAPRLISATCDSHYVGTGRALCIHGESALGASYEKNFAIGVDGWRSGACRGAPPVTGTAWEFQQRACFGHRAVQRPAFCKAQACAGSK